MTQSIENKQDFENLLVAGIPKLRRFALARSKNSDLADDLVQQTCMKALAASHQFTGGNLDSWLSRILQNELLNLQFRGSRIRTGFDFLQEEIAEPHLAVKLTDQESYMEAKIVEAAMNELPRQQRAIVERVAIYGDTIDEASQKLGIPGGTIKSSYNRARQKLCAAIGECAKKLNTPDQSASLRPDDIAKINQFLSSLTISAETAKGYRSTMTRFFASLDHTPINAVTPALVRSFIRSEGKSRNTTTILRKFFAAEVAKGTIANNPVPLPRKLSAEERLASLPEPLQMELRRYLSAQSNPTVRKNFSKIARFITERKIESVEKITKEQVDAYLQVLPGTSDRARVKVFLNDLLRWLEGDRLVIASAAGTVEERRLVSAPSRPATHADKHASVPRDPTG